MEPVHPAASAQEEGGAGSVLQRPDRRTGEEVRDAEISVPPGAETAGQDAAAQRETGEEARTGQNQARTGPKPGQNRALYWWASGSKCLG